MDNHIIYYSEQIPITGGAYLPPDYTYIYLSKIINFFSVVLNIALAVLFVYLIYLLLSLAYEKYREILDTVKDTNKKVTNINNYIQNIMLNNQKQEISNLQIESPKKDEEDKVYIVDEDGVVVQSKKTEE